MDSFYILLLQNSKLKELNLGSVLVHSPLYLLVHDFADLKSKWYHVGSGGGFVMDRTYVGWRDHSETGKPERKGRGQLCTFITVSSWEMNQDPGEASLMTPHFLKVPLPPNIAPLGM